MEKKNNNIFLEEKGKWRENGYSFSEKNGRALFFCTQVHLADYCVGQFRLCQYPGAHYVVEIQFFAYRNRGQGHASGSVLVTVPGRQRVSHVQDKTYGGLRLRGGPDKRHVFGIRNG